MRCGACRAAYALTRNKVGAIGGLSPTGNVELFDFLARNGELKNQPAFRNEVALKGSELIELRTV